MKAVEQKCSVGSNPTLSSSALILGYGLVSPTGLLMGFPVRIGFTCGYGVMLTRRSPKPKIEVRFLLPMPYAPMMKLANILDLKSRFCRF